MIEESDRNRTNPGDTIREVLAVLTVLDLIDEWVGTRESCMPETTCPAEVSTLSSASLRQFPKLPREHREPCSLCPSQRRRDSHRLTRTQSGAES